MVYESEANASGEMSAQKAQELAKVGGSNVIIRQYSYILRARDTSQTRVALYGLAVVTGFTRMQGGFLQVSWAAACRSGTRVFAAKPYKCYNRNVLPFHS